MNDAQDEIERWREEAAHWRKEAERLQKQIAMETSNQVDRCETNHDKPLTQFTTGDARSLIENHEFIADLARFAEGITSEQAIRKKYHLHLDDDAWTTLGTDDALVEAIEAEKVRRVRDGSAKRERAQQLMVKAPDILDSIMSDTKASAKHRIDASKVLDTFAANGPGAAAEQDRFIIRIDLTAGGGEVLEFNKPLKPDPNDGEIIDATPQKALVPSTAEDDWKR